MPEQIPYIDIPVEIYDNPEPRCPCVLLVDTSGSMSGAPVNALNDGIQQFQTELIQDPIAQKRVEVAVVSFGNGVETVCDFTPVPSFVPPRFEAAGATPMGAAVVQAISLLEERKRIYRSAGLAYFRPWIFLITDGEPTDMQTHYWRQAIQMVHEGESSKKLLFFGVGVQNANFATLNELCPPNRQALKLRGLSFGELFKWLSASLRQVSSANPGATQLNLPAPSSWASIDV